MGNISFKCMGSSTKKSVQYPETSRIPEKHEIANNKRNEKQKKTVPSTQPNIPPEKKTVPSTQPNIPPEKKTVPSSQPSIPPEIIIEILSWLPVKDLLRLKCVCKQWYAIIQDHHFIKKHMSRAIVATNQYNKIVAEVPAAGSFRFICGCDGLLLKMRNASYKYYIQNPTTYQILELPDPHKGSFDISFSFIPSTGDYKLVSVYNDGNEDGNEGCEVLTVGTDDSWRALKFPNLHDDLNKKSERTSVVSAGSTVHFIRLFNAAESDKYQEVVSLDLETECFTVTALSRDSLPGWEKFQALSWNGKLSFVNRVEEGLHVLVLEDHKKQKWGVKFVIPLAFLKENQEMMVNLVPLFAQRGDLWFSWKQEKVFAYNMDSGTIGHTILAPEGHRISKQVYRCPPSLVTLKGMRSEKAQPQMNQPS